MAARKQILIVSLVLVAVAGTALADGLIVPVRPDIRVRGQWAVNYHHVSIRVRDQVASVSIDQEFVNTGSGMIEVEYLFPVPPGAAIDSMTLIVNGKEFAARLLDADEARKIYEEIVRKKKDPALLEYAGFGLYRTRAFPLEPGKPAKVIVTYKYVCRKETDLVEVWYPLNTEKFSARPIKDVRVKVDIAADADIVSVYSPSHDVQIDRKDPRRVVATYQAKDVLPTTDFQLFYKAADEQVGATLLTYWPYGGKDGYFLLLVSPNPRGVKGKVVPKDVVIVIDRSGSMSGKKIDQAREAARFILEHLNEGDRFNVIAYNDTVEPFFDGLVQAGLDKPGRAAEAREMLDRIEATGGTNIHDALKTAMGQFRVLMAGVDFVDTRPKYVIFLTDGLPTVGVKSEPEIIKAVKAANEVGARLFAFGVGYDVNVRLLDKLTGANRGLSEYVKPAEPIESKVSALYRKIKNPVMTDLKMRIDGVKLRNIYPRELGDLFEGDQLVVLGRYMEKDVAEPPTMKVIISGRYQGKERTFEYPVTVCKAGETGHKFVEKLWAVRRVGWLLDQIQLNGESEEIIDELVRLSKAHGIMTPYTSFLAEETVDLAGEPVVLRRYASRAVRELRVVKGGTGQRGAANRQALSRAERAPAAMTVPGKGVPMLGHKALAAYEADRVEFVECVRQAGQQALYRRGRIWIAANASDVDPEKDADKILTVDRFTEAYFKLARANNVQENQLLASQQEGEELLVRLRGQVYRIR